MFMASKNDVEMNYVEVRFHGGKTQRFEGAREAAKEQGYPDVPTYLRSTDQVRAWCEEVPREISEEFDQAELARRKIANYLREKI